MNLLCVLSTCRRAHERSLLSDGSPVCAQCSYICSACKETISNEAIVTGASASRRRR